jgi:hypothetical protein
MSGVPAQRARGRKVQFKPPPGLAVRFLYVPSPCAQCGWRSYVRATNTTDRCAKCGRERV